jgi:hypothetical protein
MCPYKRSLKYRVRNSNSSIEYVPIELFSGFNEEEQYRISLITGFSSYVRTKDTIIYLGHIIPLNIDLEDALLNILRDSL